MKMQYLKFSVFISNQRGTDPLPAVYSRHDRSSWDTRAAAASLRRWHTASEPRVCVYWWRQAMDAVQTAAAQHDKDGRYVVCVVSSAASDSGWAIEGGLGLVQPVRSVRNLCVHLDSELSMNTHIPRTVSCCFAVLHQIRSISRSVSQPVVQSLIVSLVISRLDYGSATLASLPACQLDRLQSVLNAAARLIYRSRKFEHVTPLLHDTGCKSQNESRFGWRFRRTAVRMDLQHSTLLMTFNRWRRSSHGNGCVRRWLRHWSSHPRRVLQSTIALSLSLPLGRGTAFRSWFVPSGFRRHLKTVLLTRLFPL